MSRLQPVLSLVLCTSVALGGCASRSVAEGPEAFAKLRESTGAERRPVGLGGVEVAKDDMREPDGTSWLYWIPLVPFATTEESGAVSGHELEQELEKALFPRFRETGKGGPRVLVRCHIDRARVEETRTLYALTIAGGLVAGLLGLPVKFMHAEVEARMDVVDPAAPAGREIIFSKIVKADYDARAGIMGYLYWYNTDVKPRDLVYEAWERALRQFVDALPEPASPIWVKTASRLGAPPSPGRGPR